MMLRLFFLFTAVPALELFLLLKIGAVLGPFPTFLMIIITGMIGAQAAKREGLAVLQQLQEETARGQMPAQSLVEGALIVAGGILLITPGVLTDLFGFSLVLPWTRKLIAPAVMKWASSRVTVQTFGGAQPGGHPYGEYSPPRQDSFSSPSASPFDHPVE